MCPERGPKRSWTPECPDWLGQTCLWRLSALAQLCRAPYCCICDFTTEISVVLEKMQILFIAHYFLPFDYSVTCSEKLGEKKKKCPGQGADEVLFLPMYGALENKMTTN